MLLAVDVGNTQTVLGLYDGEALTDNWRIATDRSRTGDELGVLLSGLLDLETVDGICLSSTVPALVREWELLAERWAHTEILVVGPGVKTGVPIRYDDPREVGPDRIANSVAARAVYGAPAIVVDFGTSTNFDVVSPDGEYVGGVLAPGIETSMDALFARAAQARQDRLRRAAERDRQDDRRRAPVRRRLRVRRPGRRHRRRNPRRARTRPTPSSWRQAGSRSSSPRTRRRSVISTRS